MTIANQLTLLRLLLAPVVVVCIVYGRFGWAILALAVAGVTDMVDGGIARRRKENSQLGALLDPVADKVLIVSAVVTLALPIPELGVRLPAWLAILVLARDATILIVAAAYNLAVGPREFKPSRLGKATTAIHVLGILWILVANLFEIRHPSTLGLFGLMAAGTAVTSVQYLWRIRNL